MLFQNVKHICFITKHRTHSTPQTAAETLAHQTALRAPESHRLKNKYYDASGKVNKPQSSKVVNRIDRTRSRQREQPIARRQSSERISGESGRWVGERNGRIRRRRGSWVRNERNQEGGVIAERGKVRDAPLLGKLVDDIFDNPEGYFIKCLNRRIWNIRKVLTFPDGLFRTLTRNSSLVS